MHVYVLSAKKEEKSPLSGMQTKRSQKKLRRLSKVYPLVGLGLMPSKMPNMLGLLQPYAQKSLFAE